jgi:hypothetical protein
MSAVGSPGRIRYSSILDAFRLLKKIACFPEPISEYKEKSQRQRIDMRDGKAILASERK